MPVFDPDREHNKRIFEKAVQIAETEQRERIRALLIASWPRWLSPFEISVALVARRAPRTLREMMADDRTKPQHLREFEEMEVPNAKRGRHKVYRVIVREQPPTLF